MARDNGLTSLPESFYLFHPSTYHVQQNKDIINKKNHANLKLVIALIYS